MCFCHHPCLVWAHEGALSSRRIPGQEQRLPPRGCGVGHHGFRGQSGYRSDEQRVQDHQESAEDFYPHEAMVRLLQVWGGRGVRLLNYVVLDWDDLEGVGEGGTYS